MADQRAPLFVLALPPEVALEVAAGRRRTIPEAFYPPRAHLGHWHALVATFHDRPRAIVGIAKLVGWEPNGQVGLLWKLVEPLALGVPVPCAKPWVFGDRLEGRELELVRQLGNEIRTRGLYREELPANDSPGEEPSAA